MKIELKKFQFFERMSEETNAFVADVYIDGKNVGNARNDGQGGSTYYQYNSGLRSNVEAMEKAEKFCLSLPPIKYDTFEIPMNLEHFIDDLVTAEIKKKDQKKFEKKMEKAILFGVPNGRSYAEVKFKIPLAQIPKEKLQGYVDKYKKEFKEGEKFLNTNFEKLGIKI